MKMFVGSHLLFQSLQTATDRGYLSVIYANNKCLSTSCKHMYTGPTHSNKRFKTPNNVKHIAVEEE